MTSLGDTGAVAMFVVVARPAVSKSKTAKAKSNLGEVHEVLHESKFYF